MNCLLSSLSRLLLAGSGLLLSQTLRSEVISPNIGEMPVIEQLLVIEGQPTDVEIAPVLGDKEWALTARWDDNNQNSLNMLRTMAAAGMKGTFYLNISEGAGGREFAQKLSQEGSSVGGHTENHNFLTHLSANRIFREILFNRISRETDTDRPINSFAFPFGRYKEDSAPLAFERITNAWLRSGYHHNVYMNFILENPYMPENFASSGNQIYAGDREVEPEKFHAQMNRILDDPEKYQAKAPVISMGVHTWQPAAELAKLQELLPEYTTRDDFWVCNQTELAAYRLQAVRTQVVPKSEQANAYEIIRPAAAFAGNAVPLTLRLVGPKPDSVKLDGAALEVEATADPMVWLVNLPYPEDQQGPTLIDWASSGPGFKRTHVAAKFPDLEFTLNLTDDEGWELVLTNNGETELTDLYVTVRLPLIYENGVFNRQIDMLGAGETLQLDIPAGELASDDTLRDGSLFAAAQVDFMAKGVEGRLYSVYQGDVDPAPVSCIRDASVVAGPLEIEMVNEEALLPFSQLGAELLPVNETALGQWRAADPKLSQDFVRDRFVTYTTDRAWRRASAKYKRQPSYVLVAVEFSMDEAAPLTIDSDRPVVFALIDGAAMTLVGKKTTATPLDAGAHRIILCLDTEKRMSFSRGEPQHLALLVNGAPLTELTSPSVQ
jgi:peptidoglycan/xylan/chitin deacetylase (PgdA/CDA1 family)